MKTFIALLALAAIVSLPSRGQEAPPEKALKYHEALLKRPDNPTLFDRFVGAWLDEQALDSLDTFLTERAEKNGGQDLAILARHQLRRGQEEQALDTLGKAITALPEQLSLPLERAKILLRSLDFENARKDLKIVAESSDETLSFEASKLIGKSYLREGKPEEAIKTWDTLLAAHPGDEDLLEDLVESAATEGELDQALAYVDKLIATSADPYKKTLRQLRRGDLLAQSGKSDDAIEAYSATLANVGEGSWLEREVLAQIEKTYQRQDRLDDLTAKLIELAEANPRRLLIHRQLAKIEAAQGQVDAAVGRFREVLKRSPGDRELREEFIRLLTDGEKFQEAAEELEKLIAIAPEDSGLMLQMADLRNRENSPEKTLAALEKAHALLDQDETSSIRIAGLMFQYKLNEAGEKLLSDLAARENATVAPSEALAAEYARTQRKDEALVLLKQIAAADNLETVLRAAASISALGKREAALEILSAKTNAFGNEPRFLATIAQAALAANKPEIATQHAVKLVRISNPASDLAESIGLALRSINAADKSIDWRTTLENQDSLTPAETCLLAALADSHADFDAVAEIMDGATDPTLIRFHTALLDRRGEFDKAIAVLASLADTDEGRKASYFKDISDLQRRAGLTEEALATIELWKQSAPGDKTPWIIEGSILREEGRADDAVKVARQAVARFGDDSDLAATLASLYEEAGQPIDAEAIYWRLYDEAASPTDQSRWAVSLAKLAHSIGRTEELEEKLRARSRSNRRSIGPILALAELARITENEDKRRDLLLEAVRLQPKDIDLRLQIANLEEQSGNPDRVLAILEEAVTFDSSNRVRSALAQAYLRQGQAMKGMRELRAMAGSQADDPRAIEQSAASLAASGLYEEAIRFLREVLPDGGDWRTKYLLAIMLEHDGRETEAIPIFQSLRQATGEIKGIQPPAENPYIQLEDYEPDIQKIYTLMFAGHAAYAHRDSDNHHGMSGAFGIGNNVGPFILPNTAESVQTFALIHLVQLKAADVENADFIREIASSGRGFQQDFNALLTKFPNQPGVLELALLYAGQNSRGSNLDTDLLRKLLAEKTDLSPIDKFRANLIFATHAKATDEDWKNLISSVDNAITAEDKDDQDLIYIAFNLLQLLAGESTALPDGVREPLSQSLLKTATMEEMDEGPWEGFKLIAIQIAGTPEQWIEAVNADVKNYQNDVQRRNQPSLAAQMRTQMYGNSPFASGNTPFVLPTISSIELSSLPGSLVGMLGTPDQRSYRFYYGLGDNHVDPKTLLDQLNSFDSPLLRAFIALSAGDETAIDKAFDATFPEIETTDAKTLRALRALEKKDYPQAYQLFSETRPAISSDRSRTITLNFSLIAIATEMDEQQRAEITDELRALLLQARRIIGTQGAEVLAAQANSLGFPDLAKRFVPARNRTATSQTPNRAAQLRFTSGGSSRSSGSSSMEKVKEFAASGKHEAAALEALNAIRKANTSPYGRNYELRELTDVTTPEVTAELFKLIDPGDSNSLTKRMEYADICLLFKKHKEALATLHQLNKERPEDPEVSAKLAFLLPEDQRELALELIKKASSQPRFAEIASSFATNFSEDNDEDQLLNFFSTTTTWLENSAPDDLSNTNLTWVSYHAKSFLKNDLFDIDNPDEVKNSETYKRHIEVAKRLALAMIRHGSIAEEGFRLLRSNTALKLPNEDLDALARDVLMSVPVTASPNTYSHSFFSLQLGNSSSSSGDVLAEHSSASWLTSRLASVDDPATILPSDYLADLREKNPLIGKLTDALANLSEIDELEKLWQSDVLKKSSGLHANMLTQALLARAASIPGASTFFLECLREVPPASVERHSRSNSGGATQLVTAALNACSTAKPEELEAICVAISEAFYGKDFNFENIGDQMKTYQAIRSFESIFRESKLDTATTTRINSAFFQLGIPIASNDYYLVQSFRDLRFKTVEEAEKYLASNGWLDDAQTWQAFAAVIVEADHSNTGFSMTKEDSLLLPQVFSYMNHDFSRSDLAKHLEKRQPQTFGALICAASINSGKERARLTELAFTNAAPILQNLTPERYRHFSTVLSWLSDDAFRNLPPALRDEAESANAERLLELQQSADDFLKNTANNQSGRNPLDEVEDLVAALAPLNLEKSLTVFLEAERRFTDSLTRGGRLSSYSSSGLSITERDESLMDLLQNSDSQLGSNIPLALQFHAAVVASPEASRFSFSASWNDQPLLCEIGEDIYDTANKKADKQNPAWLIAMQEIETMPEEIRNDAHVALACHLISGYEFSRNINLTRDRGNLAKRADIPEKSKHLRSLTLGINGWEKDNAAGKDSTAQSFAAFAADETIAPIVRFQFASLALTEEPKLLNNKLIAETFASMFEAYAHGERSIVNNLGLSALNAVAKTIPTEDIQPQLARINSAFWENANSPKNGGHPDIPTGHAPNLFLAAAVTGDEANAKKLLTSARLVLQGKVAVISSLIATGNHNLAKQLLPDQDDRFYLKNNSPSIPYDRTFEQQMTEFRKTPDLNPLQLLRLEAQFKGVGPYPTGSNKPTESEQQREQRLVNAYRENPPTTLENRVETLSALTRDSHTAAIALRDEVIALRNEMDHAKVLEDYNRGTDDDENAASRYAFAPGKTVIFRQAAFLEFLEGDLSGLNELAETISNEPAHKSRFSDNGNSRYLQSYLERILESAPIWICEAVSQGKTSGFDQAFEPFAKLSLTSDGRSENSGWQVSMPLCIAEFFAYWQNDGAKFENLRKQLTRKPKDFAYLKNRFGILQLSRLGNEHLLWNHPTFKETRHNFLVTIFSRPEMNDFFGQPQSWLSKAADLGLRDDFLELAAAPPQDVLPIMLPHLLNFKANQEFGAKRIESGTTYALNAIEACPDDTKWNNLRFIWRLSLVDNLLKANQPDQAKKFYDAITTEDLNENQTKRHKDLGAKIVKASKK